MMRLKTAIGVSLIAALTAVDAFAASDEYTAADYLASYENAVKKRLASQGTSPAPAVKPASLQPKPLTSSRVAAAPKVVAPRAPASQQPVPPAPPMGPAPKVFDPIFPEPAGYHVPEPKPFRPIRNVQVSGRYRLASGIANDFILNDSDANKNLYNLQGPNSEYIFGEQKFNTYDPAIYSQHILNIDAQPADRLKLHTKIVNDPWSLVGTTGEQIQRADPTDATASSPTLRYNLKYFGANNSTISETYRGSNGDRFNFPRIKVHDGHTTYSRVEGLDSYRTGSGSLGHVLAIPQLDIQYEYRPIRELWADYEAERWRVRVFAMADEGQALTTNDPLGLSNHKDYWEASPWLYQYQPLQRFFDPDDITAYKRGYYSDSLAFKARDSEGNRLVRLRGVSLGADWDHTMLEATVAAPYTPWDEDYFEANNIPGAVRLKHLLGDNWFVGGTYTFRDGRVDDKSADFAQVLSGDTTYQINPNVALKAQVAGSYRQRDQLSIDEAIRRDTDKQGYAYKAALESAFDHAEGGGRTEVDFGYTQMDKKFDPVLSRYSSTRDDKFWGTHLSFDEHPDVEPFRIGDGIDVNRAVVRLQWREKRFQDKFYNLFDIRNVHRVENSAFMENVVREEATVKFTPNLTGKALFRWRDLPKTTAGIEPALTSFYFPMDDVDPYDFTLQNAAVKADKDADQFTYSGGLQYVFNERWTAEGIYERTNAIPDFPRGLLSDVFRAPVDRVEGILIDRMQPFLYDQTKLKGVAPYPYFNIFKERIIYRPQENLKMILHATQNEYRFAGGIDDNITHAGLSADFKYSDKLSFFADYTLSRQMHLPHLLATGEESYAYHNNFYLSSDYRINSSTVFRAEYGVIGLGSNIPGVTPYSVSSFSLPTLDTEHLFRMYLTGDF